MTRYIFKAMVVAACAAGVAACETTPNYPVRQGYVAPAPIQPKYPVQAPPSAPQSSLTPSAQAPRGQDAAAAPEPGNVQAPAPVESQTLAPAAAPPPSSESPPPPAPIETPPESSPPVAEPAPYTPSRVSEPAHYIADGKVIEAKGMFRDYVVQRHDHLDAIARDLQTTRAVLLEANHLKPPYHLEPGQHLRVPVAKAYVVQSGDTMTAVAKRFDVSPGELADLNDLPVRGRLKEGIELALPDNYHDHGPIRVTSAPTEMATTPAYRPPRARPSYTPRSGPYVPSASALAAGEAYRNAHGSEGYGGASSTPTPYRAAPEAPAPNQAAVVASGRGLFIWPVKGDIISGFGVTGVGRRNDGIDIRAPMDTVVHAAAAGEVVYAGNQVPGFGDLVLVKHANGWVTAYAHLDKISVQMRQTVMQGQELGSVGNTGGVTEPQLHFEIRYAATPADKAKPLDPTLLLPQ
jgi:murein DD-endopeptidase MepM/ murein hydrolase activator NlpD